MKIKFGAEQKKYITVAELSIVKQIISDMKEDDGLMEYAEIAARIASGGYVVKVYERSAEIAKNGRIYNAYGDDTENLDIWINAAALTSEGFVMFGIYLTDVWNITGDNEEEIKSHMYIRKFQEVK